MADTFKSIVDRKSKRKWAAFHVGGRNAVKKLYDTHGYVYMGTHGVRRKLNGKPKD